MREGVTNVLRHSTATTFSLNVRRVGGVVRLEIENDGVGTKSGSGYGLEGLAARAAALSGRAAGWTTGDGRFRLVVEVPEVAPTLTR